MKLWLVLGWDEDDNEPTVAQVATNDASAMHQAAQIIGLRLDAELVEVATTDLGFEATTPARAHELLEEALELVRAKGGRPANDAEQTHPRA